MRKLALILPVLAGALALGACQSSEASKSSASELTVADVARMESDYAHERSWSKLRHTIDGRTNAFDRDLGSVWSTINRHFFNYSADDPYVNFETDETYLTVFWSQTFDGVSQNVVPWIPFGGTVIR
ncbi:MAG: hypothetical protein IPM29_18590 [Planctomycetes bacterium]|nr:hypothetical protein [Planctomycetota bacterium]